MCWRIHDEQFELAFQEIVDRAPVDPSAFHRHMGTAGLLEPVGQRQQVGRHRTEGPDLLVSICN